MNDSPSHIVTMRKLPVYLLIDTSGSMIGEPIESVKVGMDTMLASLRQDTFALESLYLSIITFDSEAHLLLPLTALDRVKLPCIRVAESGATHLGAALELLIKRVKMEVKVVTPEVNGDWMPLLFVMTDGKPSDMGLYNRMCDRVHAMNFARIVACAAGMSAKVELLYRLTTQVYILDTLDSTSFKQFFSWVSDTIGSEHHSSQTAGFALPCPPKEIDITL